jgi:hypothetical protein
MVDQLDEIKNIGNRLQFTIVMVLFFPTFLGSLSSYIEDPTSFLKTILSWNVIIGLFIIIYLIVEIFKKRKMVFTKNWIHIWIDRLLLVETGSFLPLFFLGSMENVKNMLFILFYKILVSASIFCMMFIPIAIIVLFLINCIFSKPDSQA